ncbi:MAG: hypothetical protein E6Q35_04115 [Chryseobacterium cucumeris]|nr:MAG: hypothetical protein E6Q35_04115 [Chryseobacterium cucumeris]
MKILFVLSSFLMLTLASCNKNHVKVQELSSNNKLSNKDFDKLLMTTDILDLNDADFFKLFSNDPDVKLLSNRIAKRAELVLLNEFKIYRNNVAKDALEKGTGAAAAFKNAKDNRGKSASEYNKELINNYAIVYTKYVILKKISKDKFRSSLNKIRPTYKTDFKRINRTYLPKKTD